MCSNISQAFKRLNSTNVRRNEGNCISRVREHAAREAPPPPPAARAFIKA